MKIRKIIVSSMLVVAITVSATFAWAGLTIKFVNQSSKNLSVKVQTMMPPSTNVYDQTFTLNANKTQNLTADWPCVKSIWIDNVQKLFTADEKSCISLAVIDLVVTVKSDGTVAYTQE